MSRSSMDSREAETAVLLDEAAFQAAYRQWRDLIRAELAGGGSWALVGIKRRGSVLARRLWEDLRGAVADLFRQGPDWRYNRGAAEGKRLRDDAGLRRRAVRREQNVAIGDVRFEFLLIHPVGQNFDVGASQAPPE